MFDEILKVIGAVVFLAAVVALIAFLAAYPTMLLWNFVVPSIFGLTQINFWQALALNILCSLLFKSHSTSSSKK